MKRIIYIVLNESKELEKIMSLQGFEILIGNGEFEDDKLALCGAMIPGKKPVTSEILDKAPNLEIICKYGVGLDKIDLDECIRRGITVTNTPLTNYISVAEHAMTLLLAAAKKINEMAIYLRHEFPDYSCRMRYHPIELYNKTLVIIGLGNIGRRMAKLARGFDMNIIGFDPMVDKSMLPKYIELADTLESALERADFISIHVAGIESTRNLIDEKEFNLMKSHVILVNTTRGFVINEEAMYRALKEKRIAGAGLDVFAEEPIRPGNPLLFLENVVVTPHCAANTPDAHKRAEIQCAENILAFSRGEIPQNVCTNQI